MVGIRLRRASSTSQVVTEHVNITAAGLMDDLPFPLYGIRL